MTNIYSFGNIIKEKRLASNLRMDDVARMAGITRSTLWSIEKGNGNCSMNALFKVLDVLELSFSIDDEETALYGESPLYVFSLYEKEKHLSNH